MKVDLKKERGIASIVALVVLGLVAVALPVSTKLVQNSQENRSSAANKGKYGDSCENNEDCESGFCTIGSNYLKKVCSIKGFNTACVSLGGSCNAPYKKGNDNSGESCMTGDGYEGKVFLNLCLGKGTEGRCCVPYYYGVVDNKCKKFDRKIDCESELGGENCFLDKNDCYKKVDEDDFPISTVGKKDGVCGSANGQYLDKLPTEKEELCVAGVADHINTIPENTAATYNWLCHGIEGGETVKCSAKMKKDLGKPTVSPTTIPISTIGKKNGVCGSANGQYLKELPTEREKFCAVGVVEQVGINPEISPYRHNWLCHGIEGGKSVECSLKIVEDDLITISIDGLCGEKINSCEKGIMSPSLFVLNSFPGQYYRWRCLGVDGGKDVNCKIKKDNVPSATPGLYKKDKIDGVCGEKINSCEKGQVKSIRVVPGYPYYLWYCGGINGGKSVLCKVKKEKDNYLTPTPLPVEVTPTPVLDNGSGSGISFKFSLSGVKGGAECIVSDVVKHFNNFSVYVLDSDTSVNEELYIGLGKIITLEGETNIFGDQIFLAENLPFTISKFKDATTSAVRIKTGSHIQRRYCVDGQKSSQLTGCGVMLGESYDFSDYPMIAGDITGFSGNPDGVVNVLDYSFVKNQLAIDSKVGCNKKGDLNADGVINSLDLRLIELAFGKYNE